MGLLSRTDGAAVSNADDSTVSNQVLEDVVPAEPVLKDLGIALRERIKRLPQKKTTPYTALSLLKAYGSFQAGICLTLQNGIYSSYASVGMGIEKTAIPQEIIWSGEKARDKFFKLDSPENLKIKQAEKDSVYWVFPLDQGEPWGTVMILRASEAFDPEPLSVILEDVVDKVLMPASVEPDSLEGKIVQYHRNYPKFHCILLENPIPPGEEEKENYHELVSKMINTSGTVIPTPSGHPLVLLPPTMDRELIVHMLSKTLNTRPLLSFEANSPETTISKINSYT